MIPPRGLRPQPGAAPRPPNDAVARGSAPPYPSTEGGRRQPDGRTGVSASDAAGARHGPCRLPTAISCRPAHPRRLCRPATASGGRYHLARAARPDPAARQGLGEWGGRAGFDDIPGGAVRSCHPRRSGASGRITGITQREGPPRGAAGHACRGGHGGHSAAAFSTSLGRGVPGVTPVAGAGGGGGGRRVGPERSKGGGPSPVVQEASVRASTPGPGRVAAVCGAATEPARPNDQAETRYRACKRPRRGPGRTITPADSGQSGSSRDLSGIPDLDARRQPVRKRSVREPQTRGVAPVRS